jgi:hypothetical protein
MAIAKYVCTLVLRTRSPRIGGVAGSERLILLSAPAKETARSAPSAEGGIGPIRPIRPIRLIPPPAAGGRHG